VVELVGPAGAGKSTVFESLVRRHGRIEGMPVLSRGRWAPLLLWNVLAVLAMLVRRRALGRQWTRDRLLMMAYLQALPRTLNRRRRKVDRTVVFDQGPIYLLTRPVLLDDRLGQWWERTFRAWASLLDVVVLLEAPDRVLIERINARSKVHRMKRQPDAAALEFIADGRAAYESAIRRFQANRAAPAMMRFDTSRRAADEIVDEILAVLPPRGPRPGAHGPGAG
jgi:hypothetical protein